MDASHQNDIAIICVFTIVWAYAYHKHFTRATAKKKKKRAIWVIEWLAQRRVKGEYNSLVALLMLTNHYRGFIQMTDDTFQELLRKIKPYIEKKWTVMGDLTPAEDKLTLTLRFLATSDSYSRFGFLFFIYTSIIPFLLCVYQTLKEEYCSAVEG